MDDAEARPLPRRRRRAARTRRLRILPKGRGLVALASALWVIAVGYAGAAALPRAAGTGSWTVYRADAAGTGRARKLRAHAAVRSESGLSLARSVIGDGGRGHGQAFHGLTGDLGDEVEVLIDVQDGQPGEFSGRGDDQIRY